MAGFLFLGALFVVYASGVRFTEVDELDEELQMTESQGAKTLSGEQQGLQAQHMSRACLERASLYEGPEVARLLNKKGNFTMIQVGANDGCSDQSNDPVYSTLKRSNLWALLLEPNPTIFKKLQGNLEKKFGATPRLVPAQEAVCPDKTGTVSFYEVADQFAEDFPGAPHWAKYELSSMSEQQVTKHWEMLRNFVQTEEHFRKYVKADQVPCFAPKDLMKHHAVQPSAVDLLMVDAEGFDGPIVGSFLEVGGFAPEIIIFEQIHLNAEKLSDVLTVLKSHGYTHECSMNIEDLIRRRGGHAFKEHSPPCANDCTNSARPKCPGMNVLASKAYSY